MAGTQQTGSIDMQNGAKVETHADGLNAGTPPVTSNSHESNTERMLRQLLRNQEMLCSRLDRIRTRSSHSVSRGELTRSGQIRCRNIFTPSLTSRSVTRPKRKLQGQALASSGGGGSNNTGLEVGESVRHNGTDELDYFCGSFGALDLGGSGQLDPAPPTMALVAKGKPVDHGLKHVCNLGLEMVS